MNRRPDNTESQVFYYRMQLVRIAVLRLPSKDSFESILYIKFRRNTNVKNKSKLHRIKYVSVKQQDKPTDKHMITLQKDILCPVCGAPKST